MEIDLSKLIGETTDYDKKLELEIRKPKSWCKSFKKICNEYSHQVTYHENVKPRFYSDNSDFVLTLFNLNYGTETEAIGDNTNTDLHQTTPNAIGKETKLPQTAPNCPKLPQT